MDLELPKPSRFEYQCLLLSMINPLAPKMIKMTIAIEYVNHTELWVWPFLEEDNVVVVELVCCFD